MLRQPAVLLTSIFLALGSAVTAQSTRVAFVDINRITDSSEKINAEIKKFKSRAEEIQTDIEIKRKRIVDIKAEVKKGEGVLADSEMKKKRDEASKLESEIVELEAQGQKEVQRVNTSLFEPMVRTISVAIEDVAKEKSIDLVLKSEAIVYGSNIADISDDVIKKLNSGTTKSSAGSAEDKDEPAGTTTNSATTQTKNSAGTSKSTAATKETDEASSGDGATRNPLFPSVPLVTRPVDRQPD